MCVVGVRQHDFLDYNLKRNVKFVQYSSKIANLDNNDEVDLDLPCGVCACCDELRTTVRGSSL